MNPAVHREENLAITYDASRLAGPSIEWFSVEYWQARHRLSGRAAGRGSAWFIDAPFDQVVLRQYLRGGWAAKLSRENYFFTTVERSRPFREFKLLSALYELGLPVPAPVAALCEHRGFLSTGAIMTAYIKEARTLADGLDDLDGKRRSGQWASVGKCIRSFHDAGLDHADLNARNILLDSGQRVFVIDFDRAVFKPGKPVSGRKNLQRLRRSLLKICPPAQLSSLESAWVQLLDAYDG